jgi:transposase InsO family protein
VFYTDQIEFLGVIISDKGVSMDPRRVGDIVSWDLPQTYRDVQVFLGFCNFYRRFIRNYSRIALPLTSLMKGSVDGKKPGKVNLTLHERVAFRRLIAAFQSAPLLRHFDPSRPIRIETDASNGAMAGILSQPDDQGAWHLVAMWSRKFSGAETRWGTPDQELYAIVYSFKHWRHYLEARWYLSLTPFDFVIKHRPGKANPADGPSRRWLPEDDEADLTLPLRQRLASDSQTSDQRSAEIQSLTVDDLTASIHVFGPDEDEDESVGRTDWEELGRARRVPNAQLEAACASETAYQAAAGEDLKELIERIQDGDLETQRRKSAVQQEAAGHKGWSVGPEGLLRFRDRIYIPAGNNLRQELLSIHHDDPLAGHFGRTRTLELVKRKYHWPNIDRDVAEYVQDCQVCQGVTAKRHKPYGELHPLPIPKRPWAEISMDFITGLPETVFNKSPVDAILVIVDRFTKWSLFLPVSKTITAAELAELFHNEVELRYGPPEGIVSDRGSVFTSKFWSRLCFISRVRLRLSTAFHPQTDGQTERMNQTLEHYLRCFIAGEQLAWPKLLRSAEFACNNAVNATTGASPYNMLMGYSPDFRQRFEGEASLEEAPAAAARIEKLEKLRTDLKEHWRNATESMTKHYNKSHTPLTLKKGSLVGLSTKNLRLKGSRKLLPRFIGPFRITEAIGTQAYRLSLPEQYDRIHNVFHVSLLEPWTKSHSDEAESMPMPDLEDEEEYEVEEVKDECEIQNEVHFLVKWKGWPSEYNQWVSEEDMANAKQAIHKFRKGRKQRN